MHSHLNVKFVHSKYPFTEVELDNRDFDQISAEMVKAWGATLGPRTEVYKCIGPASAME